MLLRDGDKVVNQHGHNGRVVRSKWNSRAPFQVIDQFSRYHTEVNEDGSSAINNIVWQPVTTVAVAI